MEQVQHFKYSCDIAYDYINDVDNKINTQIACHTIQKNLKHKTSHDTKLKFYKTMALPVIFEV